MIPFVVVVRDELAHGATQRALADQDHALEAGFLDGAHEALRVGVQVRRASLGGASVVIRAIFQSDTAPVSCDGVWLPLTSSVGFCALITPSMARQQV